MNTLEWRRAEIPAGNAHTNARAIARMFGALANGGLIDSLQLLAPETTARARSEQASGPDAVLFGMPTRFALGYSLPVDGSGLDVVGPRAFASLGAGGSMGFADPDARVGFGYVMNQMQAGIPPDSRAVRLIEAVYASL